MWGQGRRSRSSPAALSEPCCGSGVGHAPVRCGCCGGGAGGSLRLRGRGDF